MKRKYGIFWLWALLIAGCQTVKVTLPGQTVPSEQLEARMRKVLFEAVESDDPAMRCHALESLAKIDGLEVPTRIRRALYDPIPAVRFAAAVAAGDVKDHTSRSLLERLLHDQNVSVRLAAVYGLEKLGDRRFRDWYDRALFGDDAQLAAQACMLLGKLGHTLLRQDSPAKLWKVLRKKDQAVAVRLQAAEALARLGDKEIIKRLLVFASSGYADDRLLAIFGMEQLGGPDVYAMLTVLADDPQLEVQLAAVRALANQSDATDLELVRNSLSHVNGDPQAAARVRGLAALALGKVGKEKDSGLLYQAMADEMAYVRVAAARAAIDFLQRHKSAKGVAQP